MRIEGAVFVVVGMGANGSEWEPMGALRSGAGGASRRSCQWKTGAGSQTGIIAKTMGQKCQKLVAEVSETNFLGSHQTKPMIKQAG